MPIEWLDVTGSSTVAKTLAVGRLAVMAHDPAGRTGQLPFEPTSWTSMGRCIDVRAMANQSA